MALIINAATGMYETDATPPGAGSEKLWSNFDDLVERSGGGLLNPRKFGVKSDGATDDTAAWATAIAAWKASDQYWGIAVPRGTSLISGTLLFDGIVGLKLVGAGPRVNLGSGYDSSDRSSIIKAASASALSGVPMLDFYRSHGVLCQDFSLIGQTTDTVTGAASAGIRFRSNPGVWGSTQFECERVHFLRCVNGFQAGDDTGSYAANDSETRHRGCRYYYCTNGLRINHNQSVNHVIEQPDFNTLTNGVYLARATASGGSGGGNVTLRNIVTYYIDRIVYQEYGSTNGGVNVIDGCRLDNPSVGGKRTKILEQASDSLSGSYWDIRAVMDTFPNVSGTARIVMHNACYVRVSGCLQLAGAGGTLASMNGSLTTSYLEVTGCELPDNLSQIVEITGSPSTCRYSIHHNHSAGIPHTGTSGTGWNG